MSKDIQVGDTIFSKSGTEFYCRVKEVKGSKLVIAYNDNYEEVFTISKSVVTKMDDSWEMPNWTVSPDQL